MAKIRHLQQTHDLKSYRNACRIVRQLRPYIHETFYEKEKVIYLNKEGRELIGSTREVKKNMLMEHTLLCNEAYLYFKCPLDWKTEYVIETKEVAPESFLGVQFAGLKKADKKKVVSDAAFSRNGYLNLIEIDNKRSMIDNRKKIENYTAVLPELKKKKHIPSLYIFTTTTERKKNFEKWIRDKNIKGEIKTFEEIR